MLLAILYTPTSVDIFPLVLGAKCYVYALTHTRTHTHGACFACAREICEVVKAVFAIRPVCVCFFFF